MTLETTTHALLAVLAQDGGDADAARAHLAEAERRSRSTARRERQIVEIAGLVVAGRLARATDLALIHTAEYPDDVALLAPVTDRRQPRAG